MHVKDLRKGVQGNLTGGTPAENDVPVGTGQGNWKEIIRLAKKNGIAHCFIEDESNQELDFVPTKHRIFKEFVTNSRILLGGSAGSPLFLPL